ncbi:hypothetical protein [Desulfobacter curvatus]|uniref:hypothetical protein n=1 Tax=Desulfobacter curvatus TaxID=2290 RepID=UPI0003657A8E|nr:hypothetical protein [Desulfobacter curvatus]
MIFSKSVIENMGFTKYPVSDVLEIQFGIVMVYSIQGINFNPNSTSTISKPFEFGENCTAVISDSINDACRLLIGDDFIDEDEQEWIKKKKVSRPFAFIFFKEFQTRTLKGGYRKEHEGSIITYDAFPEGKQDIQKWEKESLPSIITSLVVHLSTLERPVSLILVKKAVFGETNNGVTLFDLKMTGSANVIVSSGKTSIEMDVSLSKSSDLYGKLEYKTSRHFYSALNEKDRLKQFLNYFLFIERETHRQFKSLSYESDAKSVFNVPQRLSQSGNLFFEDRFNDSRNLAQRFHWCAILAWDDLNDQDVNDFIDIKKIRDKLAHGDNLVETELPVEKAKIIAMKLLGTEKI